jgi:pyridoxamine 5'-phosphate oxidase family protein
MPVSFRHNTEPDTIDIAGHNLSRSKKFWDVAQNGRAAFVVDDVLLPWRARRIEVRGRAEVFGVGGWRVNTDFDPEPVRITPTRTADRSIDTDAFRSNSRSVDASEEPMA